VKERRYTILLLPDPNGEGYTVTVPALPGCVTEGDTIEEAIAMAKDAVALYIQSLVADGRPVPEEKVPPQALTISVAA
jgi:antitoxin HicB